jgi:hypothetical protein
MTRTELIDMLEKIEFETGLRFEIGGQFEGVQYIIFEVEEEYDNG